MVMCAQQVESNVTLILGMGVTGISCARFLSQKGELLRIADSREKPPMLTEVQQQFAGNDLHTGAFRPELLDNVNRIMLSPGLSLAHPFVQLALHREIEVIGDIELFARYVTKPVIAITGSNGKSTVTTLLGRMLRHTGLEAAVGGNLGTAALDLLPQAADVYVLELSSFQLETTSSLKPAVAAVLNVSEDHMDRYHDLTAYAASKARVFNNAACCVINRDDALVSSMSPAKRASLIGFTRHEPVENEFGLMTDNKREWLCYGESHLIAVDQLKLIGAHNLMNALAALALAKGFGVALEHTLPALRDFTGLEHRCQWVTEHNGIRWINDSKATNTGAAKAAIESMPGKVVMIGGGDGKGADFGVLRSSVKDKVRAAVLLGRDAQRMVQALRDVTSCYLVNDMQDAVLKASELAKPGDTVLLAPACASLDMFANYMERGEVFTRCVLERVNT